MKAIMYHYVRPIDPGLPFFRHLHIEDFEKQLEYFGNTYGFVKKQDLIDSVENQGPAPKGVILTFDDGFKDHFEFVLPSLLKFNLWGIFYIPTRPYISGKLIDVHRIHMLLGKYGGKVIADSLKGLLSKHLLSHDHIKEFTTDTYNKQNNDESTNYVKRVLNYYIDYKYREKVIDHLMSDFFPNENKLAHDFYLSKNELREMQAQDMIIGSHTINHPVMSKLSKEEQNKEIDESFSKLKSILNTLPIKTFCYPYGGFHTFTKDTEALLDNHQCLFSFNVESRDITLSDLKERRQALPRYDCNEFPYGSFREISSIAAT